MMIIKVSVVPRNDYIPISNIKNQYKKYRG